MKSDKSKEMKAFEIMSKHKKYIIMIAVGLALTLSLIITIWLPEDHWSIVVLNIFAMIGSGVLCSALVSLVIEHKNAQVTEKEHARQRAFILRSLQFEIEKITAFELLNFSEYAVLKYPTQAKKGDRKELSLVDALALSIDYLQKITSSINMLYQHADVIDSAYMERIAERNELAFEVSLPYYKRLQSTLSMLLTESNMYFINGLLNEKSIETIKFLEVTVRDVIVHSVAENMKIMFEMKKSFFGEVREGLADLQMDADKKIRCFVRDLKPKDGV